MPQIDRFVRIRQLVLSLVAFVLVVSGASPALAASPAKLEELAASATCTDDTQCRGGRVCQAGKCQRGCRIAGTFWAASSVNPANPCESCLPLRKTNEWSGWGNHKCDDGDACTEQDRCRAGVCTGRKSKTCPVTDQCAQKPNGASCDDGNACTQTDTCQAGVCTGGTATTCAASDQCHDPGTCDPASGMCSNPAKATGATCSDGNACTQSDTCQAGVCSGGTATTCAASDQCHDSGTCNAATGVCSNPAKANGATCSDGNACSQTDTCQAGVCSGTNPKTCAASDQCHDAGTCNAATGVCSNPPKANGATCSDGNACTQTDTCQAGVCSGGTAKTCAASDQCHDAGTCNAATGVCSNPPKANGAACSDGNACSQTDTCQAGVCSGTNPKTCTASDQCHAAGTCNPATGVCSNPPKANGAACSDGNACSQTDTCQAGVCSGANPKTCTALDQCHDAGTCNPANGVCSNSVKANGAACNDGDLCTTGDTCQAGACHAGPPVDCEDEDGCTVRACDPATGTCHDTGVKPELSPCEDGDFCTVNDRCFCGTCSPGNKRYCPADADPNTIDTCDTGSQQCVHRGVVGPGRCLPGSCAAGSLCCPTDVVRACAPPGESCEGAVCGDAVCAHRSDGRSECCNGVCCGDGFVCENNSRCVPQNYDETAACSEGTADCCGGQCCPHGSFCHPTTHECLQVCIDTFCPAGTTCCPTSTNKTCCDADEACFSPNDTMLPICTKKPNCVAGQTYVPSVNSCCADVGVCNDAQGEPAACCNIALQMCNATTGTCEPL